ncbi:solute carrier family 10 (sodium/bile acid cotransporter), member 7 [Fulvimarina manganoxydans]|uniref:Solute carrier family 10 (Sodium/bile acid cotransporter), member 7 n=2 Tax=Fulvimarina manganoxydans TaxID=937218 RepID=A0A1W1YX55_9HYPH|nr:solute carrier family 10 (sodium/bile acid cotransporter), member 7 [Fulvimarina manganoxydans]
MSMRLPKIDKFVLALAAAVILAILFPEPGRTGGLLHWDYVTTYGVCAVFFLYGLTLAPERMKHGLTRWKAHIVVVLTTFGLFPAVVLLAVTLFPGALPEAAEIGFFYVAALPSTVSSSVAMVSLARGNVPVAIFNATLSSLLGVVLTPALMAWYLQSSGAPVPLLPTIFKVVLLVLLPIIVGQVARHWLGGWAERHKAVIKLADRGIILAVVYGAFSNSVADGVWLRHDPLVVAEIAVAAIVLFFVIYAATVLVSKLLAMSEEDVIAVAFCGSKKSLAAGVPLAPVIFAGRSDVGLIILPIMLFHFFQLLIVSFIAARAGRRPEAEEDTLSSRSEPAKVA